MATINLLPWRAKERERRNREFVLQMLIVGLLSLLLGFLGWTYFNSQLESQREANEIVKQANTALDRDLKEIDELEKTRKDIESRMEVIQKLQGTRPIPVYIFDSLVRTMPQSMFFTEISLKDKQIHLSGKADSPNTISTLLRNLDATRWLSNSAVRSIKTADESPNSSSAPVERAENGTVALPIKPVAPEADYITFEITSDLVDVNLAEESKKEKDAQTNQQAPSTVVDSQNGESDIDTNQNATTVSNDNNAVKTS